MRRFDRDLSSGKAIDEAKTRFSQFVSQSEDVIGPTQEQLARMDLDTVRNNPSTQMMGEVFGIQPKDVPIVLLAWEYRDYESTIFTADRDFAAFSPAEHRLSGIEIKYIPV